jgi:GTPase
MKTELRIASIGNVDSAKTTTISVISNNILDNGRGIARSKILKHPHEEISGRTSTITQHYIETDNKIIGFIDLAGHEKYLKTTASGLNGCFIDYALITIGADRGIIGMAKEHLTLAIALKLPIIIVITKLDIAVAHKLNKIRNKINSIFSHVLAGSKEIVYVNDNNIYDIINRYTYNCDFIPVFETSNVKGTNINILRKFIYSLNKYRAIGNSENKNPLFKIDDTFQIKGIGLVVSGIVQEGVITEGDILHIGPFNGKFIQVLAKSLHNNFKQNIKYLQSGQCGCINIRIINSKKNILQRNIIKKGCILIKTPKCVRKFEANVRILHHPTTIKTNYEPIIHCGSVRQSAKITHMSHNLIRTGDTANVTFEFKFKPEFIELNKQIIFREGLTKGIGTIIKTY